MALAIPNIVSDAKSGSDRPTLGLALGGGAARGWSHIGVLEVLAEAGIVPDVIAGTSIGAVAGGAYAAGKLDALRAFATGLNTTRRVSSLVDLTPLSSGLSGGRKLDARLRTHLDGIQLEDLPIRTVFIAAELRTGHEIWLRRGPIVDLMKASYALPGVFHPVPINGRSLVDGALVNPVPVSVCRAYGARLVIAVNLSPETMPHGGVVPDLPDFQDGTLDAVLLGESQVLRCHFGAEGKGGPKGSPAVMMQSFTIIQDRLTRMRLAGDPPDVTIAPHIGDIGMFDFHNADSAIEAGRVAAQRALDDIEKLTRRLGR